MTEREQGFWSALKDLTIAAMNLHTAKTKCAQRQEDVLANPEGNVIAFIGSKSVLYGTILELTRRDRHGIWARCYFGGENPVYMEDAPIRYNFDEHRWECAPLSDYKAKPKQLTMDDVLFGGLCKHD